MKIKHTLLASLVSFGIYSCGSEPTAPQKTSKNGSDDATGNAASVSLTEDAALVSANETGKMKVPAFKLNMDNADFVQVLRCSTESKFDETIKTQLEAAKKSSDQMKWIWEYAVNSSSCATVSEHMNSASIVDLFAKSGKFFYMINPCKMDAQKILEENTALTSADQCSFNLVMTQGTETSQDNLASTAKEEVLAQLKDVQSKINAALLRVRSATKLAQNEQYVCDNEIQRKARNANFLTTVLQIAMPATSGLLSTLFTGTIGQVLGIDKMINGAIQEVTGLSAATGECPKADSYVSKVSGDMNIIKQLTDVVKQTRESLSQSAPTSYGNFKLE